MHYESIKREIKIKPIYECRCDERLQTKTKSFTRLSYTTAATTVVYYESIKRELKIKPIYECRCDARLQTQRFGRLQTKRH